MTWRIINADVLDGLRSLPDQSVQCVVTSPPYFGLRDYGHEGQIGLEDSPCSYVESLVETFSEVRRVLRDDGTLWMNIGDSYCTQPNDQQGKNGGMYGRGITSARLKNRKRAAGLKLKDLIGIPWRLAFALQDDGWYLRQDIIWHKPNPMPESVLDRCTKAHEYIFLLSKSARYFYDAKAIAEPLATSSAERYAYAFGGAKSVALVDANKDGGVGVRTRVVGDRETPNDRNARSVWTMATQPYTEAHFATFPQELPERCIKAGSREGDTILDPFAGSGTTGLVALRLNRSFVGIEINQTYCEMARNRIANDAPLLNGSEAES